MCVIVVSEQHGKKGGKTLRLDGRGAFVFDYFSFIYARPFTSRSRREVRDPYMGTYIFVKIYFLARPVTLILMRDNTRESLPWHRNYYLLCCAIKTRMGDYVERLFDWMDSTHLSSILHYFFFWVSFFLRIPSVVVGGSYIDLYRHVMQHLQLEWTRTTSNRLLWRIMLN